MTSYHGGKQRIGKKLAQIIVEESVDISEDEGFNIKGYCEPFCGMLGVYQHIPELYEKEDLIRLKYKAGDTNKSVIMMWEEAQKGWKPPKKVSEKRYNYVRDASDSAEKGYVGHQYGFGGKYFKGYAPKYGKTIDSTNASSKVVKIADNLSDVSFSHGSYTQYSNLKNYVIYCDPPYGYTEQHYRNSVTSSKAKDNSSQSQFDNEKFHDWCRHMSKNNIVFISEYTAPKDFKQIWSNTSKLTGVSKSEGKHNSKIRTEKLYML